LQNLYNAELPVKVMQG